MFKVHEHATLYIKKMQSCHLYEQSSLDVTLAIATKVHYKFIGPGSLGWKEGSSYWLAFMSNDCLLPF